MRLIVGILALAGAVALADTPSPSPTEPATSRAASTATSTPTAPSPAASSPKETTAALDPREKSLKDKGYRAESRHGEKVYCRSEEVLGSRLGARRICGTVAQLDEREHLSKEMAEHAQRSGFSRDRK